MLSPLTRSDLQLDTIADSVPLQTTWGKERFTTGLQNCAHDPAHIKRTQTIIMSFYTEPKLTTAIREEIRKLQTATVDEAIQPKTPIVTESISQILWKPESTGSFLNGCPFVLDTLITWKTIFLPLFAVLMPLLAIVIPFFVLQYYKQDLGTSEYIEHMRGVILSQISIPSVLKSKNSEDRVGFMLESLFVGGTLVMYISSLWNQIAASLHLRTIWGNVDDSGKEIQTARTVCTNIVNLLKTLPQKKQRILRYVLDAGDTALSNSLYIDKLNNVSTYGTVWNDATGVDALKNWIADMDVYTSVASLQSICFPRMKTESAIVDIQNVYHPAIEPCISNNFSSSSHTILTGPNRGGKSTFCRAVGLAIITAQAWGFAWASRMSWSPFQRILTALDNVGKLGEQSNFEAEIDFAKSVLEEPDAPFFVIMDEIFHSTNASDGVAASRVFMDRLYVKPGVISIISTHYKELVTHYTDKVQTLQLVTREKEDGKLDYTYKIAPGISDKSSVMEILEERGLVARSV